MLFKRKKKVSIVRISNRIVRDGMGYPLRLCELSTGRLIFIDTYDEYIKDTGRELMWKEVDIPFGGIVFPIREEF